MDNAFSDSTKDTLCNARHIVSANGRLAKAEGEAGQGANRISGDAGHEVVFAHEFSAFSPFPQFHAPRSLAPGEAWRGFGLAAPGAQPDTSVAQ